MKHSQLKQLIKEEIRSVLNEGLFKKFTQATINDINDDYLKSMLDQNEKIETNDMIAAEDKLSEYTYDFIKEFNQKYKQGVLGPNPLSKEIDSSRDIYKEVRNRFNENGNQMTVREIGEIVASNYLIKK